MTTAPDAHWESWRRLRDPASFEALVRPELGRALSFARSLGCSDADAEDVLQESLVRLAAERGDGPSRIGVRAWLYRTVRDRARSRRRSWWRRRDREAKAARPEAAPPRTGELEVREQVEQALAALPDAEREAVRLRYLQDLDYRDMAHVLGVSENACRIRVHRALESLKKRFGAGVATMVAALPLPESTHLDHVVGEVLRQAVPVTAKAGVAVAWKVLGGAAAVAAAAGAVAIALPSPQAGSRPPRPPAAIPGATTATTAARPPTPRAAAEAAAAGAVTDAGGSIAKEAPPTALAPPSTAPPSRSVGEDRARPVFAGVVGLLEPVARNAWDRGLPATGAEIYRRILDVDPAYRPAMERATTEKEDTSKGERYRGTLDKQLAVAFEAAARLLSELAVADEAAGDVETARTRWALALDFHDQDPVANERMGNTLVDGRWFTERGLAHRKWQAAYLQRLEGARTLAVEPEVSNERTGVSRSSGIPMVAYSTRNFRIEGNLPAREIQDVLVWLERSRRLYLDLFDVPDRMLDYSSDPLVFVVVKSRSQLDRLVDACPDIPWEKKSFMKKFTAMPGGRRVTLSLQEDGVGAERHCIHAATHSFVSDTFGRHSLWLSEALVNAVSAAIKSADLHVCFSGEGSTGGIHIENISLEQAPLVLRDLIREKKDTPIGEIVKLPSDAMSAQMIAKSWSIVLFLLESDPGQAREYFAAAGQGEHGERSRSEKVLAMFFPEYETWKDLDAAWRAWALDVYRK